MTKATVAGSRTSTSSRGLARLALALVVSAAVVFVPWCSVVSSLPPERFADDGYFVAQVGHRLEWKESIVIGSASSGVDVSVLGPKISPRHVELRSERSNGGKLRWFMRNLSADRKIGVHIPHPSPLSPTTEVTDFVEFSVPDDAEGPGTIIYLPAAPDAKAIADMMWLHPEQFALATLGPPSPVVSCQGATCPSFRVRATTETFSWRIKAVDDSDDLASLPLDKNRKYRLPGNLLIEWRPEISRGVYVGGNWAEIGGTPLADGREFACPYDPGKRCRLDRDLQEDAPFEYSLTFRDPQFSQRPPMLFLSADSGQGGVNLFGFGRVEWRSHKKRVVVRHSGGDGVIRVVDLSSVPPAEPCGRQRVTLDGHAAVTLGEIELCSDWVKAKPILDIGTVSLSLDLPLVVGDPLSHVPEVKLWRVHNRSRVLLLPAFIDHTIVPFRTRFAPVSDRPDRGGVEAGAAFAERFGNLPSFTVSYDLKNDRLAVLPLESDDADDNASTAAPPPAEKLFTYENTCDAPLEQWMACGEGTSGCSMQFRAEAGNPHDVVSSQTVACARSGASLFGILHGDHHVFANRVAESILLVLLAIALGSTLLWRGPIREGRLRGGPLIAIAIIFGSVAYLTTSGARLLTVIAVRQSLQTTVVPLHNQLIAFILGAAILLTLVRAASQRAAARHAGYPAEFLPRYRANRRVGRFLKHLVWFVGVTLGLFSMVVWFDVINNGWPLVADPRAEGLNWVLGICSSVVVLMVVLFFLRQKVAILAGWLAELVQFVWRRLAVLFSSVLNRMGVGSWLRRLASLVGSVGAFVLLVRRKVAGAISPVLKGIQAFLRWRVVSWLRQRLISPLVAGPAGRWGLAAVVLLAFPLVLHVIRPSVVESGNFIKVSFLSLKPAEFVGLVLVLSLAYRSVDIVRSLAGSKSTRSRPPVDKPMVPLWGVLAFFAILGTSLSWVPAVIIVAVFLFGWPFQKKHPHVRVVRRQLLRVFGYLTLVAVALSVIFAASEDLGPLLVVLPMMLIVTLYVMAMHPVHVVNGRSLLNDGTQRAFWLLGVVGALSLLFAFVVGHGPHFVADQANEIPFLERAHVRIACAENPLQYDQCHQLIQSVALFAAPAASQATFVPNMQSDLAISSLRGLFGGATWVVVLCALIAIALALSALAWMAHELVRRGDTDDEPLRAAEAWRAHFLAVVFVGVAVLLLMQTAVHVSSSLSLYAMTGVTLPFISAGGGSILAWLVTIGVVVAGALELAGLGKPTTGRESR